MVSIIKCERGAALPLALGVMLVLSLLGAALWQYSTADTLHAANDRQRAQAYYLARAGAEAALRAYLDAPGTSKPTGTAPPVSYGAGTFQVSITEQKRPDSILIDGVRIDSYGRVGAVQQKVTVTVTPVVYYGHELNPRWYHPESGVIADGVHGPVDGSVILQAKKKLKEPSNRSAVFRGTSLFFSSGLGDPFNDRIELHAETIVFYNSIEMHRRHGQLVLFVLDGKGITRPGRDGLWGRVYFADVYHGNDLLSDISRKAFYYPKEPGGIDLTQPSHRSKLELIEDGAAVPRPEDASCRIIWS